MKPKRKPGTSRPRAQARTVANPIDKVLEACAQLQAIGPDARALREEVAAIARRVFVAGLSGFLADDGQGGSLEAVSREPRDGPEQAVLLSHARSFAQQALEQNRLLKFRFSYQESKSARIYYGLALPLVTKQCTTVLFLIRLKAFSPAELSALGVLGQTARMALDNIELATLQAGGQENADRLLELYAQLGNAGQLDTFLDDFVVRVAGLLGFERAFVAAVEGNFYPG
jgi:hypothetical protein